VVLQQTPFVYAARGAFNGLRKAARHIQQLLKNIPLDSTDIEKQRARSLYNIINSR
jgi:hypothetical protein